MKRLRLIDYLLFSAIILGGVGLDQLTKRLAVKYLMPRGTLPIIKDALHLTYHTNDGMAFGLLDEHRWIFMVASAITICVLAFLLYSGRLQSRLYRISVAMVISGGIGNMIDRIALGEVIDFIDFRLINFAIFNVADSIVCIGAALLILALVLDVIKEGREKRQGGEE